MRIIQVRQTSPSSTADLREDVAVRVDQIGVDGHARVLTQQSQRHCHLQVCVSEEGERIP
jgi:hypothetical protein